MECVNCNNEKLKRSKYCQECKDDSVINNLRYLYLNGSSSAKKFARRQLVNFWGYDDDSSPYDHGEPPSNKCEGYQWMRGEKTQ